MEQDQPKTVQKLAAKPGKGDGGVKGSKEKAFALAKKHGIDGLLLNNKQTSFSDRAEHRERIEAAARQKNLEQIMVLATQQCGDDAGVELDNDWFTAFIKLAEEISSRSMQQLWAKILSLEIASPGAFSVKALTTLKQMTHREAVVFQRLCNLASHFAGDNGHKLLTGYFRLPGSFQMFSAPTLHKLSLGKCRMPYSHLMLLTDLGLIYGNELESGELTSDQQLKVVNNGLDLNLVPSGKRLKLYYYKFTQVGNELVKLIPEEPDDSYIDALKELLAADFQFTTGVDTTA